MYRQTDTKSILILHLKTYCRRFIWLVAAIIMIVGGTVNVSFAATVDRIIATVNDDIVTLKDYEQFVRFSGDGYAINSDIVEETILKRLIEEKIIVHEARKRGIEASDSEVEHGIEEFMDFGKLTMDDFKEILKEDGIELDDYRKMLQDKIIFSKFIDMDINSKIIVHTEEVEAFYANNRERYVSSPERVELKAIFLALREGATMTEITDLKRRALHITALLRNGGNFDTLMYEYSDEPVRGQEGLLGTFERGVLIPALNDRAFSLQKHEISDPICVEEGIYILKVADKFERQYRPIEDVQDEIYQELFDQKRESMLNDWVKGLWEQASVTINQS